MGPAVAYAFVLNTKQSWRWCYYYLIIWNAVALFLWTCFYFPPTFYMKHGNQSKLRFLKDFDYIGTGLFIAGIVLFLMGLSWGGSLYPWKSAHVIATIVVGLGTLIAFGFYESLASLKEPFIPMHLFKRGPWVATTMVIAICGGVFYAFAIVWPTMASTLYSRTGDSMYTGYIATLIGSGITLGEIIGGLLARRIGKTKYQLMATWLLASIFLGCESGLVHLFHKSSD
jgi:MFS family permease